MDSPPTCARAASESTSVDSPTTSARRTSKPRISEAARRVSAIARVQGSGKSALIDLVKASADAFMAADLNHDEKLEFAEFKNVIPSDTLSQFSDADAKEIFDAADFNGDGAISREEFFFWTFSWVTEHAGVASGLERAFRRFDTSGDGALNLREFTQAVELFGFGELGHDIFSDFDEDEGGTISYTELLAALKARKGKYSNNTQKLLTTMSFDMIKHAEERRKGSFSLCDDPWTASNAMELRDTICSRMLEQLGSTKHVWLALINAAQAKRRLDRPQFCRATRTVLGFEGPESVLCAAYAEMDDDKSGEVSYDELDNWLNCKPQRRRIARELNLEKHRHLQSTPLSYLQWTPSLLRAELQRMCSAGNVTALDLLGVYDKGDDGTLSLKEYLRMMKKLVGNERAWHSGAKDCCLTVFRKIAGEDSQLDIEEFVRWIPHRRTMHGMGASASQIAFPMVKKVPTELPQLTTVVKPSASLPRLHSPPMSPPAGSARRSAPTDAFAGRGLAARWLLAKASTKHVEAIESGETLPLSLLDTWFVLPERWHSPASPPRKQPKRSPRKHLQAEQKSVQLSSD